MPNVNEPRTETKELGKIQQIQDKSEMDWISYKHFIADQSISLPTSSFHPALTSRKRRPWRPGRAAIYNTKGTNLAPPRKNSHLTTAIGHQLKEKLNSLNPVSCPRNNTGNPGRVDSRGIGTCDNLRFMHVARMVRVTYRMRGRQLHASGSKNDAHRKVNLL